MSTDGQRIFATAAGDRVYASTDGGESWSARATSGLLWHSVGCSATGEVVVAGGNVGQLYVSTDYGVNWTARDGSRNWFDFACTSDGTGMLGAALGGAALLQSRGLPPVTLAGAAGTAVEFRYQGSGNWQSSYLSQPPLAATSSVATVLAAGAVTPTTGHVRLSAASAVTLSTTAAIADGSAAGSLLLLEGTSDTATVTVPNAANTKLGAARTLGSGDVLTLLWNGTDWIQVSFSNN